MNRQDQDASIDETLKRQKEMREREQAELDEQARPFCPNCGEKCDDVSKNLSSKEYHIFNCEKCEHTCQIRFTRGSFKTMSRASMLDW